MSAIVLPAARRIGVAGTTLAHGALIAAVLIAARQSRAHGPMVYQVNLIAAPLSAPTVSTPTPPPPAPVQKAKPAPKTKAVPKTPPKKAPPAQKIDSVPAAKTPLKVAETATPSTGTDAVTVHQDGVPFPDPEYLKNIENQILQRWHVAGFRPGMKVAIAFVINRDGTVPDSSIIVDTPSTSTQFDNASITAIESASAQRAFKPLPAAWAPPSLPILFNFIVTPRGPQ